MSDEGHAVSYKVLRPGTPVWTSDAVQIGTVAAVLENEREHIFDGLVVETAQGGRWVDAPEVARIAERRVTLTLDAAAARDLPERDAARSVEFKADVRRRIGRLWRRR